MSAEAARSALVPAMSKEAERVCISPEMLDERTAKRLRVLKRADERPEGVAVGGWLARVAAEEGVSVPTIYRWIAERRRGKVASDRAPIPVAVSLSSGPLEVSVRSRAFAPQALGWGFSLLARRPEMGVKQAYLETAAKAEEEGWEIGSLASFYRKWSEVPDAVRAALGSGRRAVGLMVEPPILRDLSRLKVYEVLVGDQHIFDYTVLDDEGEAIRPQMFAWADMRSRYFSGVWPVMGSYDRWAVGLALREACRWGIPEGLYTDWGRPERSGYVERLRRQLSGWTAFRGTEGLGELIPHVKAKPRNARAKPIESWFWHALERPLLQRGLSGYSRKDGRDEERNARIQEVKGRRLLRAREFFEIVLQVLGEWHAHAMAEEGIVPGEVFAEGIRRPLVRLDDRTLDFMFLPSAVRQVRKSMVEMTLPGHGKCRWHAPELSAYCRRGKGARVEVRFDPYDPSVAHCLDLETQELICTAELWGKEDPRDMDAVAAKIRRQNALVGHWMELARQLSRPSAKPAHPVPPPALGHPGRRPEPKLQLLSPYAKAAAEARKAKAARELAVDDAELDRKIIALAESLGVGPSAQALGAS